MMWLIKGLLALLPEGLDRLQGSVGFVRQALEAIERDEAKKGLQREDCTLDEAAEYLQLIVQLNLTGNLIDLSGCEGVAVQWTGRLLSSSECLYHRWVGVEVAKHLLTPDLLLLDNTIGKLLMQSIRDPSSLILLLSLIPWHPPHDPHSPIHALINNNLIKHADPRVRHAAAKLSLPHDKKPEDLDLSEITLETPNRAYLALRFGSNVEASQFIDNEDSTLRLLAWRSMIRDDLSEEFQKRFEREVETAPDPFHAMKLFEMTPSVMRPSVLTALPESIGPEWAETLRVEEELARSTFAMAPTRLPVLVAWFYSCQEQADLSHWQDDTQVWPLIKHRHATLT